MASRRLAVFCAVLLAMGAMAHRLALVETQAFLAVLGLVGLLLLASLVLLAAGFARVWNFGDRGAGSLLIAVAMIGLLLAPVGVGAYAALTRPFLVDLSTDPEDPPAMVAAAAARRPPMNALLPLTPEERLEMAVAYGDLAGRRYGARVDRVLASVEVLAAREGWTPVAATPRKTPGGTIIIEALARTPILYLPVDVAVRLSDEGNSTYVDMRSASRYGPHDLGDNAARIERFMAALDQLMAELPASTPDE